MAWRRALDGRACDFSGRVKEWASGSPGASWGDYGGFDCAVKMPAPVILPVLGFDG